MADNDQDYRNAYKDIYKCTGIYHFISKYQFTRSLYIDFFVFYFVERDSVLRILKNKRYKYSVFAYFLSKRSNCRLLSTNKHQVINEKQSKISYSVCLSVKTVCNILTDIVVLFIIISETYCFCLRCPSVRSRSIAPAFLNGATSIHDNGKSLNLVTSADVIMESAL